MSAPMTTDVPSTPATPARAGDAALGRVQKFVESLERKIDSLKTENADLKRTVKELRGARTRIPQIPGSKKKRAPEQAPPVEA